jgi:hypothetical protein
MTRIFQLVAKSFDFLILSYAVDDRNMTLLKTLFKNQKRGFIDTYILKVLILYALAIQQYSYYDTLTCIK